MPNLGVSEEEAEIITNYLLGKSDTVAKAQVMVAKFIPAPLRYRHLFMFFGAGFGVALILVITVIGVKSVVLPKK